MALCAAATLLAPGARAAIEITPVRIEVAPGQTAAMTIRNSGSGQVPVQVDAFAWSQGDGGEDRLEAAVDLVVVPPIFVLEPGGEQIVRIAHTGPASAAEATYRVIFSELPPPQPEATPQGVSVRLKMSVPVFVVADRRVRPRLRMEGFQQDAAAGVLGLVNEGRAHAKVTGLVLHLTEGEAEEVSLVSYLLPGTRKNLRFPLPDGRRVYAMTVKVEGRNALEYVVP
jgi:fimbrial chaperone protein